MDESYYNGKKTLTLDDIRDAISQTQEAIRLIECDRYSMPDLNSSVQIHQLLDISARCLTSARRNFEKARWASANTSLDFKEWLEKNGYSELDYT